MTLHRTFYWFTITEEAYIKVLEYKITLTINKISAQPKESIISNIVANALEKSQKDSLVEYASGFDMTLSNSLNERLGLLKKLHTIQDLN